MHHLLEFALFSPLLGTVYYLLSGCCPGSSGNYPWYACECPNAQLVWEVIPVNNAVCDNETVDCGDDDDGDPNPVGTIVSVNGAPIYVIGDQVGVLDATPPVVGGQVPSDATGDDYTGLTGVIAYYAVLATSLVANVPMNVTLQVYQAAWDATLNVWDAPLPYGGAVVLSFTPTTTWALIGCDAPGGFDPYSFDPSTLSPGETFPESSSLYEYALEIVAIEPQ